MLVRGRERAVWREAEMEAGNSPAAWDQWIQGWWEAE